MLSSRRPKSVEKEDIEKGEALKPLPCPRCGEVNPTSGRFCFKCGSCLRLAEALKVEE